MQYGITSFPYSHCAGYGNCILLTINWLRVSMMIDCRRSGFENLDDGN